MVFVHGESDPCCREQYVRIWLGESEFSVRSSRWLLDQYSIRRQLRFTKDVKRDPYGNLYVLDTDNYRIMMYCANGQSGEPRAIIDLGARYSTSMPFDSKLNIYVSDPNNYQVLKFNRIAWEPWWNSWLIMIIWHQCFSDLPLLLRYLDVFFSKIKTLIDCWHWWACQHLLLSSPRQRNISCHHIQLEWSFRTASRAASNQQSCQTPVREPRLNCKYRARHRACVHWIYINVGHRS